MALKRIVVALLVAAARGVSATPRSMDEGGSQFIFYNGTLTGSLAPKGDSQNDRYGNSQDCKNYSSFYFEDDSLTSLYIGKNPEWDPNPFIFYLTQQSPDLRSYDISFASAYYPCYKEGKPCGFFEFSPWYYITATMLDLKKASVSVVKDATIGAGETGPFYSVTGDEKTWISNGTSNSTLDFRVPSNYTENDTSPCFPLQSTFVWYVLFRLAPQACAVPNREA